MIKKIRVKMEDFKRLKRLLASELMARKSIEWFCFKTLRWPESIQVELSFCTLNVVVNF